MKTLSQLFKNNPNIGYNWLPPELISFKETVVNTVERGCILRCGICGKSPLPWDNFHYYGCDTTPICDECWKEVILK